MTVVTATHPLHLRRPQWRSSTCKTARCPARLGWWRHIRDRGWRRSCLCCPPKGVSSVSGCEAPPERYKWTGQRWPRSCERGQTPRPRPTLTGHKLQRRNDTITKFCFGFQEIHEEIYFKNLLIVPQFIINICILCLKILFKYLVAFDPIWMWMWWYHQVTDDTTHNTMYTGRSTEA